jgi:hypothetical protein
MAKDDFASIYEGIKSHRIEEGRGRPKATDDDDDNRKEGISEVYAFVVLTDTADNRFFLNKEKTKFQRFNPKDVYSVLLGQAKDFDRLTPTHRNKILSTIPQEIGKYDKYEDDITVMDTYELEGAPASWQGSDESNSDYDSN